MANMVEYKKVTELKLHGSNPRLIKDDKFKKLVQSIKDFPEMLEKRPLVVDEDGIILGGNMRFRSCLELKLKEVPVIIAKGWTEEQKREFVIKDNVSSGEFDFDVLANEWDQTELLEWGLNLPINLDDIKSTKDIPDIGEIEFSEELFLEHNYIVLYFDNAMDWEVAQEIYNLKQVKSKESADLCKKIGVGRVINGKNFI